MGEDRLKAFASVTFDDSFVVRNMKVVEGTKGVFLCMPSRKLPDGTHKDMVHPINQDFREYLEANVLKAYEEELKNNPTGVTQNADSNYDEMSAPQGDIEVK